MNKFVKLPLFLGICGSICAGVLAVVNGITAPEIAQRLENEKNANYLELMSITSADKYKDGKVSDDLKTKNVTAIKEIYVGEELVGVVYDGSINDGWSQWNVQLGIKDGKYTGFKYSSSKPDAKGSTFMTAFTNAVPGKDVNPDASDLVSGSSSPDTIPAMRSFVSACAADYAAQYANM